jgi:hypothetical protein
MAMTLHGETSGTDSPDYLATVFNVGQARHGLGDTGQAMVCYLPFLNHARAAQSHRDGTFFLSEVPSYR